jgi:fatty acid-binding protein DegV
MLSIIHPHQNNTLMVDSFCELPHIEFNTQSIGLIKNNIIMNDKNLQDDHENNISYYKNIKGGTANNLGYSAINFKNDLLHFINHMAITGRKPTTLHIQHSSSNHINPFDKYIRDIHKIYLDPTSHLHNTIIAILKNNKFTIRIYDTRQVFTGQGLCAIFSKHHFKDNNRISLSSFRKDFNEFSKSIKTFSVPFTHKYCEENYLSNKLTPHTTISQFFKPKSNLPILLFQNGRDYIYDNVDCHKSAIQAVIMQLKTDILNKTSLSKNICVSYGGDIEDFKIKYLNEYKSICNICQKLNYTAHFNSSSISTGISLGPGHINISYSVID